MLPTGRHACRCGRAMHENVGPVAAWPHSRVGVAIGARGRWTGVHRGDWNRSCRSCPGACLRCRPCPRRDPSLHPRCSSRTSALLRSPRIPAAPRSLSPVAYTSRVAPTRAAQTGLSCSVRLPVRVLRPLPRRAPLRVRLRIGAQRISSSPRNDRLDARVVNLTRLQASRDVAARGLAPSVEALDTPLGPRDSRHAPGVCYSALRRLPRRDFHPLEKNDGMRTLARSHRHDAPSDHYRIGRIPMPEWKDTVNLPRTDFPMKANLPTSEPETLARWNAIDLYGKIRARRKGAPKFVLHDGPPYANGNIHMGTALNKILKELVVKSQDRKSTR